MGLHFWPKGGSVYPGGGYSPTLVYQKFPYERGRGWSSVKILSLYCRGMDSVPVREVPLCGQEKRPFLLQSLSRGRGML